MCRTSRNWKKKKKEKKNSLTLLKTPCATSKLFLVPRASVLSDALYVVKPQPSAFLLLWPQGHLCPSAISERAGPGSALQRPSHIDLQAGRASLLLFILSSPQSSLMTCWATSERFIVSETSSFCGTQTHPCHIDLFAAWVINYEVSLMVSEM